VIIITPTPSSHPTPPGGGTLYFELFDAVAVWGWEMVLAELAEVANVRGDGEMKAVMMIMTEAVRDHEGGQEQC
jgi:hypothetical protein